MTSSSIRTGLLVIGSGIMGAAVARLARERQPDLEITMVDGGSAIGGTPGLHVHDVPDPAVWEKFNERAASGIQGLYMGAEIITDRMHGDLSLQPGMFHAEALGEISVDMPAVALAWNAGGMGVHWTAATPWPAGREVFDDGDTDQWDDDLEQARRLLGVTPVGIGPTSAGDVVLNVLNDRYGSVSPPERRAQPMPMAVVPGADGRLARTGPSLIFPPIGGAADENFVLLTGSLATRLIVGDQDVRGAVIRDAASGVESEILASVVIVCADAVRTPQLLFASGIRPHALGRYLNEHAFVTGRVLMDLDRFGLGLDTLPRNAEAEYCTDSLWLPQNGPTQPFHGQIMNTVYVNDVDDALAYNVGLSLYVPVESRAANRLEFSDSEVDIFGMPRITFDFAYSDADLALIERAVAEIGELAADFGAFDPETELMVLPSGSSLHLTGTVRSGLVDDGSSVCDRDGRVWGYDNLFVAGTGAIPTPVVCNATLTGTITAVRAARAALLRLPSPVR